MASQPSALPPPSRSWKARTAFSRLPTKSSVNTTPSSAGTAHIEPRSALPAPSSASARAALASDKTLPAPRDARVRGRTALEKPANTRPFDNSRMKAIKPPTVAATLSVKPTTITTIPVLMKPEPQKRNVLRRKKSVIGAHVAAQKEMAAQTSVDSLPSTTPLSAGGSSRGRQSVEPADRPASRMHQVVTPISAISVTPSLTYSEGPSVFSHNTTPTSHTSYSPHIDQSPHFGPRAWSTPPKAPQYVVPTSRPLGETTAQPLDHPFFTSSSLNKGRSGSKEKSSRLRQPNVATNSSTDNVSTPAFVHKSHEKALAPPELAHLCDPSSESLPVFGGPIRPTRDGTPSLHDQHAPSPVIQSNMTQLPARLSAERRRPSVRTGGTSAGSTTSLNSLGATSSSSKRTSHIAQPRLRAASKEAVTSPAHEALARSAFAPPTQVSSPQKKATKFGFLGRRNKTEKPQTSESEQLKKGPAAGTGHEGYGRPAAARRSSSSSSGSTQQGPMSRRSVSSSKSGSGSRPDPALDDFLQQRLSPVVLRGENAVRSSNSGSSTTVKDLTGLTGSSALVSDSSLDLRSHRSETSDVRNPVREPSNTDENAVSYRFNVTEALQGPQEVAPDRAPVDLSDQEDKPKQKKPSWSIFSRGNTSKQSLSREEERKPSMSSALAEERKASVSSAVVGERISDDSAQNLIVGQKTFAHYDLFGSNSPIGFEELDSIMQEADQAFLDSRTLSQTSSNLYIDLTNPLSYIRSQTSSIVSNQQGISPSTDNLVLTAQANQAGSFITEQPDHVNAASEGENAPQSDLTPRPSRLPQVGRIPKVVPRQGHERKPPDQSFSRPFAAVEQRPNFSRPYTAAKNRQSPYEGSSDVHNESSTRSAVDNTTSGPRSSFLNFSPRKNSQVSSSTSSSTLFLPQLPWVAVAPTPGSPPSEDEVWKEYDDFIDEVVTPQEGKLPFENYSSPKKAGTNASQTAMTVDYSRLQLPKRVSFERQDLSHVPSATSTLNSSRLPSVPEASSAMTSPSISRFIAGYGELDGESWTKSRSSLGKSDRVSYGPYSPSIYSSRDSQSLKHQRSTSLPKDALRNSSTSNTSSSSSRGSVQSKPDPQSMANLRFGALMVSKWLSFGRVLFSQAHFELTKSGEEDRVLVIDGLGKDWSYYCALTYSNAQIYCLGPSANPGQNSRTSMGGGFRSLPNHRHVVHPDLAEDFPFPQNFFSVVVFRFPAAISDKTLRSVVQESKRVLRPGGYLEICTIDLDLTNMGHNCRRTVRHLKMRIQDTGRDISLKPASDNVQYLLGWRGFENLNRCIVAVPAAGTIANSRDGSHDSQDLSITELMKDPSPEGDQHITKMVARVGRWWYSRCYEMPTLPDGDLSRSVWQDKELLKECEDHSTSFKLLICHAQKPTISKRRTVSL